MSHEGKPASVPLLQQEQQEEDKQAGEDLYEKYGAERGVWTKSMLIALERGIKGNKWYSLIDKVASERTLGIAWGKVETNAGSCGVDRIRVLDFAKDSHKRLLAVREHLAKGSYEPKPIRRVYIPKEGTKERRPLGIPTVTDRVVQTAVKMVVEPIFEKEFAPWSYGFRPGRSCKEALREVERRLREGYVHVVDVDIKGYFDNIPHQPLLNLVKERISDGRVLGLLEQFLKQGILEEGVEIEPEKGSPQGGVISPLLANVYLDPLDWKLSKLGVKSVRYADDIVILARSAQEAAEARKEVEAWMEQAQLSLHPEKTRQVDMTKSRAYFDFLGYRFLRSKPGKLLRLVRPKSLKSLRNRLKGPTRRANGHSLEKIIERINPVLQGWFGYYAQAHPTIHEKLDGWVRGRLRSILRKRHKGKGRGRGLDHYRWPNCYFENLGLFSLVDAREELMSLHCGAKR